jgi:hypothetical protein
MLRICPQVKAYVAAIKNQIHAINNVIESTITVIDSVSKIIGPNGDHDHNLSYDHRMDSMVNEFAVILDTKNKAIHDRDVIINELQQKLKVLESQNDPPHNSTNRIVNVGGNIQKTDSGQSAINSSATADVRSIQPLDIILPISATINRTSCIIARPCT